MNSKVISFQTGQKIRQRSRLRFATLTIGAALASFGLTYTALLYEQSLKARVAGMYEAWWPAPVVTEPVLSPIDPVRTATPHVNVASAVPRTFVRCGEGFRVTCVVDGDTLWLNGQKIRIADIDTPEISSPGCRAEAQRGERAANRLVELLNKGPVAIRSVGDRDVDRYGRALRIVLVNEQNVGDFLIAEGLARPWEGKRRPWC